MQTLMIKNRRKCISMILVGASVISLMACAAVERPLYEKTSRYSDIRGQYYLNVTTFKFSDIFDVYIDDKKIGRTPIRGYYFRADEPPELHGKLILKDPNSEKQVYEIKLSEIDWKIKDINEQFTDDKVIDPISKERHQSFIPRKALITYEASIVKP